MRKIVLIVLVLAAAVSLVLGGIKIANYLGDKKKENHKDDILEVENKIKKVEEEIKTKKEEVEKVKEEKKDEVKEVESWQAKVDQIQSYL